MVIFTRRVAIFFISTLLVACLAQTALATERVSVFLDADPESTATQTRQNALEKAFVSGVMQSTVNMLPGDLSEQRKTLLMDYLEPRAGLYVLGYEELASRNTPEGLGLDMEVDVNTRALRETLQSMGLFSTSVRTLPFTFHNAGGLTQEDLQSLDDLIVLTGLSPSPGVLPEMTLLRGLDGSIKGSLSVPGAQWSAIETEMETLWFILWGKYFSKQEARVGHSTSDILTVSGWFTPEGALEFDRVLREWSSEIQEVELIDISMQAQGVSGRWALKVLSAGGLELRLNGYLPGRGLEYSFSKALEN